MRSTHMIGQQTNKRHTHEVNTYDWTTNKRHTHEVDTYDWTTNNTLIRSTHIMTGRQTNDTHTRLTHMIGQQTKHIHTHPHAHTHTHTHTLSPMLSFNPIPYTHRFRVNKYSSVLILHPHSGFQTQSLTLPVCPSQNSGISHSDWRPRHM